MSADKNLYRVWPDGMERFEAMALVRSAQSAPGGRRIAVRALINA